MNTDFRLFAPRSASVVSPALVNQMRAYLGRQYGDPDGWSIDLALQRGEASGRMRRIFHARHSGMDLNVALKAHAHRRRNRSEYLALSRLYRQNPDCVAPLFMARDARFYAMEWIDAPLLADVLEGPERPAALRRAGAWLARLHAARNAPSPLFRRTLPALRLPADTEQGQIGAVSARLRDRLRQVSFRSGPQAVLHGDFHPGNFFDTGTRILAFDREHDCHGLTFVDIAKFLTKIAVQRDAAAADARPWAGDAESDRRSFFDGYGAIEAAQLALYDDVEDVTLFRVWRRAARAGDPALDAQMRLRGLLDPGTPPGHHRPGRLVRAASGAQHWSTAAAPARSADRGWLARLRGQRARHVG